MTRELQAQLDDWLAQGYQVLADEVDGEVRLTAVYVSRPGSPGAERDQQLWPLTPETVELLATRGITLLREPLDY